MEIFRGAWLLKIHVMKLFYSFGSSVFK